jgi:hypothetical protein
MASGIKIVGVFLFWVVLGLSWAILNENLIDQLDTMFPEAYAGDLNTFSIMLWAWRISLVGLCIGSGVSILGQRGFRGAIVNSMVIFSGVVLGVFLWASFWNITNNIIPNAFATAFSSTSNANQYKGIYNAVFLVFVLGLTLLSFFTGGTAILGRRRYRKDRVISKGSYLPSGAEMKSLYKKERRWRERVAETQKQSAKEWNKSGKGRAVGVSVWDASQGDDYR